MDIDKKYIWEYKMDFSYDKSWKKGGESNTREKCQIDASMFAIECGQNYGRSVSIRILVPCEE